MPELPEVETIARGLRPALVGLTILDAHVRWRRTIAIPSVARFQQLIRGQRIRGVGRRGKFLRIQLSDYELLIHLRMSGDVSLKKGAVRPATHDRLILTLQRSKRAGLQSLVFNDTRKFGRVWLTDDPAEVTAHLGPEPLSAEFTPEWLSQALRKRHRQLKPLLLDQTFLAGLGNIYTDEALHLAKLHPLALSDTVTARKAGQLHAAIQTTLREGIRRNGASFDWVYRGGEFQNFFRVYDREGKPCPVCGTPIRRLVVGQRGTHICPNCQKE
ncbi:MAG TPA: bifunctional DNA-formamidopyrimidine glycosylase/DNA-(apurinic or apyrimidinic site) lyase [Anaerolineales bacterium]|nr:bifunctional DNA-formamidopyrimidine glycosylase/DNA-(apurinic or apyrimidinic site) lyase [Anaerolineales bacterium]